MKPLPRKRQDSRPAPPRAIYRREPQSVDKHRVIRREPKIAGWQTWPERMRNDMDRPDIVWARMPVAIDMAMAYPMDPTWTMACNQIFADRQILHKTRSLGGCDPGPR